MQKIRLMIAVILVAALFAGLSYVTFTRQPEEQPLGGGGYRDISSWELNSMMTNKDFILINVHIPYGGEIDRTDMFIPYDEIAQDLGKLPADKGSKIVVYCMSGRMSTIAAEELARRGYTNILNLDGGMISWEKSGFTLIKR